MGTVPCIGLSQTGEGASVYAFPVYDRGAVLVELYGTGFYDKEARKYRTAGSTSIELPRDEAIKLAICILRAATE